MNKKIKLYMNSDKASQASRGGHPSLHAVKGREERPGIGAIDLVALSTIGTSM